jgi:hypothetical protein
MTPLQTARTLGIEPIEAGDHEHVAGVELIEGAALIGAVGLGSTRASRNRRD